MFLQIKDSILSNASFSHSKYTDSVVLPEHSKKTIMDYGIITILEGGITL